MKTKYAKMTALSLALLAATPSQAQAPAFTGFDVNDLNILFPRITDKDGTRLNPDVSIGSMNVDNLGITSILNPSKSATDSTARFELKSGVKPLLLEKTFADIQEFAKSRKIGTPANAAASDAQEKAFAVARPGSHFHAGAILDNWRVVSLRYDSCFPLVNNKNPDTEKCIEHVRLIAQPISAKAPEGEDTTMHLLYAVRGLKEVNGKLAPQEGVFPTAADLENRNSVVSQLRTLKNLALRQGINTNGVSVAPHPALAQADQTKAKAFGKAVQDFIRKNCAPEKLMVITYMGLEGRGPEPWIFFGGDVNVASAEKLSKESKTPRWVAQPQPTNFKASATEQDFEITFSNINPSAMIDKGGKVFNKPLNNPDLFKNKDGVVPTGFEDNVKKLFDAPNALSLEDKNVANRLENAVTHAPHNTDCFSCHATNSQMIKLGATTVNDTSFIAANGVTAFIDRALQQDTSWNTHNFSYFRGKPTISYLAVSSMSDVAEFTNRQLGAAKDDVVGPGAVCTEAQRLAIRSCTMFETEKTYEACAKKVNCAPKSKVRA